METLIEQDFEFNKYSLIYGQFLQEVHESVPGTVIGTAPYHPYKDQHTHFVTVSTPERIAVVLKLRFGAHLRNRPEPPKVEKKEDEDYLYNKASYYKKSLYEDYIKKREYERYEEECYKQDLRIITTDYLDILKPRNINKSDSSTIARLYNEMKKIALWDDETKK